MTTVRTLQDAEKVSKNFGIPLSEIVFIEFNRTGVWLPEGQVPVSFRARFLCDERFSQKSPMYFAVPVKDAGETKFFVNGDSHLTFGSDDLGAVSQLEIDTCDCSYFRKGKKVLNLNSNQRGNCRGCTFCIHNYPLYDERVLKDKQTISGKPALRRFLAEEIISKNGFADLSCIEQIAVVTGLFQGENAVVQHIADVREVACEFGFNGPIFFLGSELRSAAALAEIQNYAPFSFCYALDCLTERDSRLKGRKGDFTVSQIIQTLACAREQSFEVTFSYIVGLDPLIEISRGFMGLLRYVNRFPIVNIYQTQHPDQRTVMTAEAGQIDYYLQARRIFESFFLPTTLRPHNWENYRSLWYHWFEDEFLPE